MGEGRGAYGERVAWRREVGGGGRRGEDGRGKGNRSGGERVTRGREGEGGTGKASEKKVVWGSEKE